MRDTLDTGVILSDIEVLDLDEALGIDLSRECVRERELEDVGRRLFTKHRKYEL